MKDQLKSLMTALAQQNADIQSLVVLQAKSSDSSTSGTQSTVSTLNLPFQKFDESTESFVNYLDRLKTYFKVHKVPDTAKAGALVSLLSPKLFGLLKDLLHPETHEKNTFEELEKILTNHFSLPPLVIPRRFALINRKQQEGESITAYMSELRKLAAHCKYTSELLNTMLRDVFVGGIRHKYILDRLFEEDDIQLSKTLEIALMERASIILLVQQVLYRKFLSMQSLNVKTRNQQRRKPMNRVRCIRIITIPFSRNE